MKSRRQSRQSRRRQSVVDRAVRVVVGRASSAEPSESSSAERHWQSRQSRRRQSVVGKRYIDVDGNVSFPKTGPNAVLLRKKGQIYPCDVELKGDSVGTPQKPKFSLKKMWLDDILPYLDEITGTGGPLENFKVKFQEDGAGPHTKKSYVSFLKAELDKRGWYYTPQPPNSPLTNVLDLLIFRETT